jgi:hypothetical protein
MGRCSRAIVAAGVVGVLLVGCSSSSKPKVDTNKVLTKLEYIQAANDICKTYRERINGVVSSEGTGLSLSDAKDVLTKQLIPLFQEEHTALIALKPPAADAANLKAALVAMNSGINTIIGRVGSATSTDELDTINPQGLSAWKGEFGTYGALECGSPPTSTTSQ